MCTQELLTPQEYLQKNRTYLWGPTNTITLYYPGAWQDYGPLDLVLGWHRTRDAQTPVVAIYVDYACTRGMVLQFAKAIESRYRTSIDDASELKPEVFGKKNIRDFYHKDMKPKKVDQWIDAQVDEDPFFGTRVFYSSINLTLIYLKTDAIETYQILQNQKIFPNIIVLQDHGLGGQWTRFCGDSMLYNVSKVKPTLLYVHREPWPNYKPVSKYHIDKGQMHQFERRLYLSESVDWLSSGYKPDSILPC